MKMRYIELLNWKTNKTLFSGHFASFKACIEDAINKTINLDYILIENQDLRLANLDGAVMNYARMRYCNLQGANLSECELEKSQFVGCDMTDVCFKDSNLILAQFQQCLMKNVHVDYADIRGLMVTCPTFLKCDFSKTPHMGGAVFLAHGTAYSMSRPPVYIHGTPVTIILLDEHIMLGDTMVLHNNQLGLSRHCLMDLARDSKLPPEELLQTLWAALRERNLHVPAEKAAA